MKLSDQQKFDILKTAYLEQRKEAAFWRDRSWKTTTWVVGLFLAISTAGVFTNAKHPVLLLPLIGLSLMATVYLCKNYRSYQKAWQRVSRVERALEFYTQSEYLPGDTLLPANLPEEKVTRKGTVFFILTIWIVAIAAFIAVTVPK